MASTSSSLSSTNRYSDIGATPQRLATARIETASSPSPSAISTASASTRSRVSSAASPDFPARLGATTVPERGRVITRPSARSTSKAFVAVASATPNSWATCRVDGTLSPGSQLPVGDAPAQLRGDACIGRRPIGRVDSDTAVPPSGLYYDRS